MDFLPNKNLNTVLGSNPFFVLQVYVHVVFHLNAYN